MQLLYNIKLCITKCRHYEWKRHEKATLYCDLWASKTKGNIEELNTGYH